MQQANTAQDSAIATLQNSVVALSSTNTAQDGAIAAILTKNTSQDSAIASLQQANTAQDSAIATLQSQVAALTANLSWTNLSLINGWINYSPSGVFNVAQYAKANGWVFLRGAIQGGSSINAQFATLPTGFRPALRQMLDALTLTSSFAYVTGRIDVELTGAISNFGAANFVVSLDGLAFYVGT